MPTRKYSATTSTTYRFSINGQEKDVELNENITTAMYWEYDSRIGRRWNVDPVLKIWESPYSCFSNNPILRVDPNGDTDSTKTGATQTSLGPIPKFLVLKTPNWSLRVGETFGPYGSNASTSIYSLYGGKTYYNSSPWGVSSSGQDEFKIDEPNSFIQLQKRIGGKNSNLQIGLNWFKQKFRNNSAGYGYEAPTAIHASFGVNNNNLFSIGKLNFSSNISVGGGIEVGMPRFDDNINATIPEKSLQVGKYSIIGYGFSAIYRIDATYSKRLVFFMAGTLHHLQTFDQETSIGTQPSERIGSVALTAGLGFNFGK
jgi:hypothetical protein